MIHAVSSPTLSHTPDETYFRRNGASVRAMLAVASARDIAASDILANTTLTPADLAPTECEVDLTDELTVIRNLLRVCGDRPGLGAQVGAQVSFSSLGKFALALLASRTLREAIALTISVRPLTLTFGRPLPPIETDHGTRHVFDERHIEADVRPFVLERDLTLSGRLMEALWTGECPLVIECPLDQERRAAIDAMLRSAHVVAGVRSALIIDARTLDEPLPHADPLTLPSLLDDLRVMADRRSVPISLAQRVRARLAASVDSPPPLQEIADDLHLDARSLRRALEGQSTSYRRLLDDVRCTRARELLTQGLTVGQAATKLGYHDAAAFSRAFRRWFGCPPGAIRRTSIA